MVCQYRQAHGNGADSRARAAGDGARAQALRVARLARTFCAAGDDVGAAAGRERHEHGDRGGDRRGAVAEGQRERCSVPERTIHWSGPPLSTQSGRMTG
jgi:hypothetical protein